MSHNIECATLELNNVTTTANGNVPTTIPAASVPLAANCNNNNAVPSFYVVAGASTWTLHLSSVSNGAALANTTIAKIVIKYI